jgi:hypothetical protein
MRKKGQEEMVGFALIIILVAIILLVFVSFSIKRENNATFTESYRLQSFISSMLQYSYDTGQESITIRDMIKDCERYDENCEALKKELEKVMDASWRTGNESVVKCYLLDISSGKKEILMLKKGEETGAVKGAEQTLSEISIRLSIYN